MPNDIAQELDKNPGLKAVWEKLPPSHQNEYLKWINQAKKPETRAARIAKMLQMLQQR